ncbi:SpaA isopeptide-forming pilin-related protein [Klugiella xanthotipulae]|nr:SpaA isopeptide-forming pilin-related protein [Klugiella xanthotipulae]
MRRFIATLVTILLAVMGGLSSTETATAESAAGTGYVTAMPWDVIPSSTTSAQVALPGNLAGLGNSMTYTSRDDGVVSIKSGLGGAGVEMLMNQNSPNLNRLCLGTAPPTGKTVSCGTGTATITFAHPIANPRVGFGSGSWESGAATTACSATWADIEISAVNGQPADATKLQLIASDADSTWSGTKATRNPALDTTMCGLNPQTVANKVVVSGMVSSVTFVYTMMARMTRQVSPAVTPTVSWGGGVLTSVGVPSADLQVVKSAPALVDSGGTINWSVAVSNAGPADSHGFTIRDVVPANVTNPVLVSAPAGCTLVVKNLVCSAAPSGYTVATNSTVSTVADATPSAGTDKTAWVKSVLDAGQAFTNIRLSGTAPVTGGAVVTNTATVAGVDSDPVVSNNTSTVTTTTRAPVWSISKTATVGGVVPAEGAVKPGDVITYTVTASASSGVVTGVVLTDDLSKVLNNATFVPGSARLTVAGGAPVSLADPVGATPKLVTPSLTLTAPQTAVLTYQVTVGSTAWSSAVTNVVTGTGAVPPTTCAAGVTPVAAVCTTTTKTAGRILIQKLGSDGNDGRVAMGGSQFQVLTDSAGIPGSPVAGSTVTPVVGQTGLFEFTGVRAGTYWLQETAAPAGHSLLAQPVAFTLSSTGVLQVVTAAANPQVTVSGSTITVVDAPALALPLAGSGPSVPYTVIGLLALVCVASLVAITRFRVRRRM